MVDLYGVEGKLTAHSGYLSHRFSHGSMSSAVTRAAPAATMRTRPDFIVKMMLKIACE